MTETDQEYWQRKYRVLLYIHERGDNVTADEISSNFGMSRMAAAVILSRYNRQGILLSKPMIKPNNPGPPYHVHRLSAKGERRLEFFANKIAHMKAKEAEAEEERREIQVDVEILTKHHKITEVD